jgi:hypothetical protein
MWKTMKAGDGSNGKAGGGGGGISGDGARINHGRDLDRRGISGADGTGANGTSPNGAPRVTESQAVFQGAADSGRTETPVFSRELAYSDESAAASPSLIGATASALGGQGLLGFAGGAAGLPLSIVMRAMEIHVVSSIMDDAKKAPDIPLAGLKLVPMRLHDNNADFEQVPFFAWTNNSTHVYVNVMEYLKTISNLRSGGQSEDQAAKAVRAMAMYVIRHELRHVQQFTANQNKPPATFQQMIDFEVTAYGNDVAWITSQTVRDFLLKDIGADPAILDQIKASAENARDSFARFKNLTDEAARKKAMQDEAYLPAAIRGNRKYAVADMYKTKAP